MECASISLQMQLLGVTPGNAGARRGPAARELSVRGEFRPPSEWVAGSRALLRVIVMHIFACPTSSEEVVRGACGGYIDRLSCRFVGINAGLSNLLWCKEAFIRVIRRFTSRSGLDVKLAWVVVARRDMLNKLRKDQAFFNSVTLCEGVRRDCRWKSLSCSVVLIRIQALIFRPRNATCKPHLCEVLRVPVSFCCAG